MFKRFSFFLADFYVEFPLSYGLPVITSEEMSTVVSTSVAPTKI